MTLLPVLTAVACAKAWCSPDLLDAPGFQTGAALVCSPWASPNANAKMVRVWIALPGKAN